MSRKRESQDISSVMPELGTDPAQNIRATTILMKRLFCPIFLQFLWLAASYAQVPGEDSSLMQNARNGDAQAQFNLARAYEQGAEAAQNDAQAVYWYRKSAEQDYAEAENSLGVMYALGRGVPHNREEALQWYRKAAKHGLGQAFYNIGISYYNGDGVDQDLDQAYAFMLLAQSKGNAQAPEALHRIKNDLQGDVGPAKLRLAEMLEAGDEVPQDLPAAIKAYTDLAGSGPKNTFSYADPYREAQFHLCQLHLNGKGVPRDYTQARARCESAAKYHLYSADVVLGRMAAEGLGQEKNLKKAEAYYQDAAVGLFPGGLLQLSSLKLQSGAHQDAKEAYFWLYVARQQNGGRISADLRKAAAGLNGNEIASIEKQATEWLAIPARDRKKPRIR